MVRSKSIVTMTSQIVAEVFMSFIVSGDLSHQSY